MKLMHQIVASIPLLFSGLLQASTPIPEQIRTALEDELYPFSNIVAGYQRPAMNPPKIAVAEFRINSDDLLNWSQAVSEILRYKIQYVPNVRLYMPAPYNTFVDAQVDESATRPLLTSQISFKNLNKTLGIESVLTGSIESNGKTYTLMTELVDVAKEGATLQQEWHFTSEDLPSILINITKWVYSSLGVELSPQELAYIQDEKSLDHHAIDDFIALYADLKTLKGPIRRDKINQLQKQHPDFTLLATYTLFNRVYAQNLDEAYKNLELYENLRASFPENAGIALESYRAMEIEVLPKHKVSARLNNLKNLIKQQPHDPTIMVVLADALINNGNTMEGIATLLEAVDRWPEYYRGWWSLGWALNKHAWQVRGNSMWRDVPELAKEKFKALSLLSNLSIDKALILNPHSALLWNLKINTIGATDGYSEELMEVFEKAAQLAPTEKRIYSNALNFADNRWGGPSEARRHIIEVAINNNPEESWPKALRKRYIDDFDILEQQTATTNTGHYLLELIQHPYLWKLVVLLVGILFFVAFSMGRMSASKQEIEKNPNID